MADKRFPIDYQQKTDPMVEDDVVMLSDSEDLGKIKRVKQSQFKWDTGAKITSATISGDDIVFSLDDSSTATLIDGAKDLKGKDWDEVELRVDSNNIEWKLSQDIARTVLTPLSAIKGDTWAKIVWADWDWNNMKFTLDDSSTVSLVNAKIDLKGDKWEPWDTGSPWAPWNDWADWKEVELQTTPTHIQWKYDTDISRNNLVLLSDLKGADGSDGSDGREIQLQTNATHIQWKYDTDVVWNDLIALSTLKGDKWDDGAKINWVSWDNNDMKFTLDDSSTVSLVNAKTDLKGDTGSTWPVGMQWKWVWIAWSYDKNDWVSYQGSSYIANKNTSQTPWGSDWDILAQQSGGAWWTITGTLSAQTDLQTALDGKAEKPMRIITKTSNYTLVLADVNGDTLLRMNSASDTTVTIPTNASVASPVGIELLIENIGTGKVTIAWAGWVTVGGDLVLENQNDTRGLVQTSANTWKSYGGSSVVPWENNIGYLNIPANSKSANYTLVLWDAWKSIDHPSSDANARTFTIPANSSVAYPIGTTISFSNMSSQDVTIAITTDTMYLAWDGATGSRTLAQYGVATIRKLTATTRLISWVGLT